MQIETKILDDLYEIREGDVETQYLKKYGKPKVEKNADKSEKELTEFMQKFIKEKKDLEELFKKINNYELATMSEMCFWHKPYYKQGFIDGMNLKKEAIDENIIGKSLDNSIIYKHISEIVDFVEDQKYKNLKANDRYNEIIKEIEEIKNKHVKVRDFLEDDEIKELNAEELKAILDIIELQNEISMLENEEMFKIGLQEGKLL